MGKDYFESSDAARETFLAADKLLGFKLSDLCFSGPEERLNQTDISQPAIYVTSVASYRAAKSAGVIEPSASYEYAGLSLGEYTALHLAGVFSFEDGLRLVAQRGRFMQESAEATPSGMVAIMGADEGQVTELCAQAAQDDVLVPANFNAPGQVVISGSMAACQRGAELAESRGFKAIPLKVAGAFHSPLMQSAADRMRAELAGVQFATGRPVWANVTAAHHGHSESIKQLLVDQIVKPVRWAQTMQQVAGVEGARFFELAPGRVLTGLLKKINRRLPVHSLETAAGLSVS
jgi:[acyl-carrier-protein] S-malonyltransferase